MPARFQCPECGTFFRDPVTCPACFAETTPDTLHKDATHSALLLRSDEIPNGLRGTKSLMDANRGVLET